MVQGGKSWENGTGGLEQKNGTKIPILVQMVKNPDFRTGGENNPDFRSGGYRNVPPYFLIE